MSFTLPGIPKYSSKDRFKMEIDDDQLDKNLYKWLKLLPGKYKRYRKSNGLFNVIV